MSRFCRSEIVALAQAALGKEVIVTDGPHLRARLVPCRPAQEWVMGLHPGAYEVAADFDAPLPDEFWLGGS